MPNVFSRYKPGGNHCDDATVLLLRVVGGNDPPRTTGVLSIEFPPGFLQADHVPLIGFGLQPVEHFIIRISAEDTCIEGEHSQTVLGARRAAVRVAVVCWVGVFPL